MKPFVHVRPDSAADAIDAVAADPDAVFLAGGTNLVDHLKLGVATPGTLVDLRGLTSTAVEDLPDGGLRIGAGVRNSDLAGDPRVRRDYPGLAMALLAGASGQLRNQATTGGNLLQRTRCAYFQDVTTPCNKRVPGQGCAARDGWTRYHAILGAAQDAAGLRHCVATHPSDMAVPMVAFDAVVQLAGPDGDRAVPLGEFHRLPGDDPSRDTVLRQGELVTAVDLPPLPVAARSTYRKVRDRASYAFALVSVAAAVAVEDGTITDARVAFGGVAHRPWRATRAEEVLRGAPATEDTYRAAADAELADATPLDTEVGGNAFKVPLLRGTLTTTLRRLAEERP
ncbi:FAD binding domain-containing protein [Actinomycetospora chiangmaiensis]|uniref:FAD binding domain-containing protein n=1 Tax=Actinomycetospora chiangmaiensis TaxID=402650 RepID=UPI00037136FE|nr:xanthine dehydrogenase family protein subunit M [Actinomycetospora chiangmaiensis]